MRHVRFFLIRRRHSKFWNICMKSKDWTSSRVFFGIPRFLIKFLSDIDFLWCTRTLKVPSWGTRWIFYSSVRAVSSSGHLQHLTPSSIPIIEKWRKWSTARRKQNFQLAKSIIGMLISILSFSSFTDGSLTHTQTNFGGICRWMKNYLLSNKKIARKKQPLVFCWANRERVVMSVWVRGDHFWAISRRQREREMIDCHRRLKSFHCKKDLYKLDNADVNWTSVLLLALLKL